MRVWFLLIVGSVAWPLTALAASLGFVPSTGIWFSKEPVFANQATKIYTVAVNNTYQKLTATVAFLDNGVEIGRMTTTIPLEEARQFYTNWGPTVGNHIVAAEFVSAIALGTDNITHELSHAEINALAPPIAKTVEVDGDIDGDDVGDHEEARYGTSPLLKDTDGDGVNDGEEIRLGRNPLANDNPPPPPPPPTLSNTTTPPTAQPATPTAKPKPIKPTPTTTKTALAAPTKPTQSPDSTIATSTATTTLAVSTPTTSTPPVDELATPTIPPKNNNWLKVLGIVAGLLFLGAGVSTILAWRERHRD